jgi:hypothetical protein
MAPALVMGQCPCCAGCLFFYNTFTMLVTATQHRAKLRRMILGEMSVCCVD